MLARYAKGGHWAVSLVLALVLAIVLGIWIFKRISPGAPQGPRPGTFTSDHPKIKAAEQQARATWPEFQQLYRARQPGQRFFVKARFSHGTNWEWIWVWVESMKGDEVTGVVDAEPTNLRTIYVGDRVTVKKKENIGDWLVTGPGDFTRGGFTSAAMDEVAREQGGAAPPTGPASAGGAATQPAAPATQPTGAATQPGGGSGGVVE